MIVWHCDCDIVMWLWSVTSQITPIPNSSLPKYKWKKKEKNKKERKLNLLFSLLTIRDSSWNPLFLFHSIYSDLLTNIADSLDLILSNLTNQVPTKYSDNVNNANSIINLIFFKLNFLKIDNYTIYSELWYLSDYTLLTVNIFIIENFVSEKWCTIIKNSKEEDKLIAELIEAIKKIDTEQLSNKVSLELVV